MATRRFEFTLLAARDLRNSTIPFGTEACAVIWISSDSNFTQRVPAERQNDGNLKFLGRLMVFSLQEATLQLGFLRLEMRISINGQENIGGVSVPLNTELLLLNPTAPSVIITCQLWKPPQTPNGYVDFSVKLAQNAEGIPPYLPAQGTSSRQYRPSPHGHRYPPTTHGGSYPQSTIPPPWGYTHQYPPTTDRGNYQPPSHYPPFVPTPEQPSFLSNLLSRLGAFILSKVVTYFMFGGVPDFSFDGVPDFSFDGAPDFGFGS